jgi:hypothetical protein
MGISIVGLLLTDFNFIFVSLFSSKLPGGYWFLVVGPVIEGGLGGQSYISLVQIPQTKIKIMDICRFNIWNGSYACVYV